MLVAVEERLFAMLREKAGATFLGATLGDLAAFAASASAAASAFFLSSSAFRDASAACLLRTRPGKVSYI